MENQRPELAEEIRGVADAITDGCTKSTITAYMGWLKRFAKYCSKLDVPLSDVSPAEAALFLADIAKQGYAGSSVVQAQATISRPAQVADREDPTESGGQPSRVSSAQKLQRSSMSDAGHLAPHLLSVQLVAEGADICQ